MSSILMLAVAIVIVVAFVLIYLYTLLSFIRKVGKIKCMKNIFNTSAAILNDFTVSRFVG